MSSVGDDESEYSRADECDDDLNARRQSFASRHSSSSVGDFLVSDATGGDDRHRRDKTKGGDSPSHRLDLSAVKRENGPTEPLDTTALRHFGIASLQTQDQLLDDDDDKAPRIERVDATIDVTELIDRAVAARRSVEDAAADVRAVSKRRADAIVASTFTKSKAPAFSLSAARVTVSSDEQAELADAARRLAKAKADLDAAMRPIPLDRRPEVKTRSLEATLRQERTRDESHDPDT